MFDRAGAERLLAPGGVVATGTACVVFLFSFFPFFSFFLFVFSFSLRFFFFSSFRLRFFFLFFLLFFFCFLSSPPVHKRTESSAHHGYSL